MHNILNYLLYPFILIMHAAIAMYTLLVRLFLSLSLWNKLILFCSVIGVIAVIVPVASFDILGITYSINNPLSITMIIVVLLFDVSIFLQGFYLCIARVILAAYYLLHFSLVFISGSITQAADYDIAPGFYINIVLMIMYIAFSMLHYHFNDTV